MKFINALISFILITVSASSFANAPQQFNQTLEANKGKVIYLDFWASWCGPCRKSFPWMNHINQKYKNKNFKVISVNVDEEHSLAAEFLQQNPANFPIIYDPNGDIATKFKLKGMPSSYIIDTKGNIVSAHVGFYDDKKNATEQEIVALLKAQS